MNVSVPYMKVCFLYILSTLQLEQWLGVWALKSHLDSNPGFAMYITLGKTYNLYKFQIFIYRIEACIKST